MKRIFFVAGVVFLSLTFLSTGASADDKWNALVEESGKILNEIQQMPDQGIPGSLMEKCSAIAIFPSTVSAALGIGGEYGEGGLRVRGWKDGYYSIAAISFGLEFGGEKKSIVFAFLTDDALKNFKEGSGWTIGGEGSLAVVTMGAGYESSIATANKPIIAFVFGEKGLMYDLSLNGAKVTKIQR